MSYSDSIAAQEAPVAGVRVHALQFAAIPVRVGPGGVATVALLLTELDNVLVDVEDEEELEVEEFPQAPL